MADNNKENRMSIDDFDFAHEDANDDTSMLVNYLVYRLHQAMGNPALQGEVQQQLHAYGILPPIQQERGPERFQGETSKRGLSTEKGVENPYQELKQLLEGKPSSKKKGHAQHERSPSREREESESSDESMEDVAPRRRRAQRSPTPTKRKRSPHSPHCRESKREEKNFKKKKERKRSPSSPSSSPSSSSDEDEKLERNIEDIDPDCLDVEEVDDMVPVVDAADKMHITSRKDLFCSLDAALAGKKVTCANNASYPIKGVGKILITILDGSDLCLPDVLYVLGIKKNLLSVSSLAKNGLRVIFEDDRCIVRDRENGYSLITTGTLENRLFVLDRYEKQIQACIAETKTQAMPDAELWHARFGHVGYGNLMTLQRHNMVHDLSLLEMPPRHVCEGYVLGKMHRFAFSQDGSVRATRKLQLVHSDLRGKLDDKAVKCIFVGYSSGSKGYRLYNPATNKIFESHDVIFVETTAQPMVAFDVPHMQTQDVFEGFLPSFVENQESQQVDNFDQSFDQHVTPHDVEEIVREEQEDLREERTLPKWANAGESPLVDGVVDGEALTHKQGTAGEGDEDVGALDFAEEFGGEVGAGQQGHVEAKGLGKRVVLGEGGEATLDGVVAGGAIGALHGEVVGLWFFLEPGGGRGGGSLVLPRGGGGDGSLALSKGWEPLCLLFKSLK
ncbi:hypothetical protein L7F22_012563 [Adiantum nelumboides]|nr:hypothetical protein [Adiantum nelumboides]